MAEIQIEIEEFGYPSSYKNVFENVSLRLNTDWKLGFVGRNGKGKTTFLQLLCGKYEFRGSVRSQVEFSYFPYEGIDERRRTREVVSELCPLAEDWEMEREFTLLELPYEAFEQPFCELSNGERTKALLAALFLNEGKFLLIDEPTNHLDLRSREVVARYLKKKRGFIVVSHDRDFLDGCIDHVLALNRTTITLQKGNFSSWWQNKTRQDEMEANRNEQLKKDVKRLEEAAKRSADWAEKVEKSKFGQTNSGSDIDRGYVGHKSAKMMKRAKSIEKRGQEAIEEKRALLKDAESAERLKIQPARSGNKTLLQVNRVAVRYGEREIFQPISFELNEGDRLALDGANGAGKSSLIKLLAGQRLEHGGTVKFASGVTLSYVPQDLSYLKGTLAEFAKENNVDERLFTSILHKLDFEREAFERDISAFSSGQKKKVAIAKSLCERARVYLWDEPLNYIDIYSRMQIENLIEEFSPTMIFVEHDKKFRQKVATGEIYIERN